MKNLLFAFILLCVINSIAQTPFVFEKTDSIEKTKSQIYSDTKLFIAKEWKSANDVIQNDDKEGGVILIKAITTKSFWMLGSYELVYQYNVTFKMKENKYKIIIDEVHCIRTTLSKCVEPFNKGECPQKGLSGFPKQKFIDIMDELTTELKSIISDYEAFIKTNKNTEDW